MRAISPGRPQSTRQALCTAHWDGLRLVAYISGNTVIILDGPRSIIQTISVDDARSLIAITIEESSGRIAVCDEHRVQIYNAIGRDEDDLRWTHDEELVVGSEGTISCLSWGSAEEILVAGTQLWLYHLPRSGKGRLIWQQEIANPVAIAAFSNDSELIATCGQYDRIVKIWRRLSYELDNTRFDVSYLPHPAAVTSIHWRKPWHVGQALDNLLYTFCSDSQIRLWTYSDPHSLSVMQLIATVDTNASIQPRRLSAGSMSRRRFVFILDSRDFSQATEKSLQQVRSKTVDHALEHLVEVANRSPEICVVFDGLGHMSAWGLENAGCRSRKPAVVFNVTLVDDVRIQLNFESDGLSDRVQFCSFAGGASPASLSLLVHSYTGQIDWYESPVARFFDTSTQERRLQLVSSWSGHDLGIDHIARAIGSSEIMSWTDEGQAILWSQASSGALQRICQIDSMDGVVAVLLLSGQGCMVSLHKDHLTLWSFTSRKALQLCTKPLKNNAQPKNLRLLVVPSTQDAKCTFAVDFEDAFPVIWNARLPSSPQKSATTNGVHQLLQEAQPIELAVASKSTQTISIDEAALTASESGKCLSQLITVDDSGTVQEFSLANSHTDFRILPSKSLTTGIESPSLCRATRSGLVALIDTIGKKLSIYNLTQGSREWAHEFSGPDRVQKMAWTTLENGFALLFVSFSYHAYIIGQQRYSTADSDAGNCWVILQDVRLRDFTTNYIGDVSWLSSGNLAVAAGNQIFVIELEDNQTKSINTRHGSGYSKGEAVVQTVSRLNGTLPVYHPAYLRFIAGQGEYGRISEILDILYEKLKYFAEGDELDSFLDQGSMHWITSKPLKGSDHTRAFDPSPVSDIATTLQEYIHNCSLPQLLEAEHDDLSDFVSVFALVEAQLKSLDENGLHYLFALYATPKEQPMPWRAFVFASRSSSQEVLLDLVTRHHNNKLTWDVARRTGLFVWLTDDVALQTQFENVARAEYTKHEDRNPVDCSLYYLALDKKAVLQGLWRMTVGIKEKENTMKLLANNFNDQRWKSTAMKNAYALLSKRRFEYAAAFFLLASSLKDAINVCVNQLHDLQLAIAIARVWNKDQSQSKAVLRDLLTATIIPQSLKYDEGRWMTVWAYSLLEQPPSALQAIVRPLNGAAKPQSADEDVLCLSYRADDPLLVLTYQQIRDELLKKGKWLRGIVNDGEESSYVLRVAGWLSRAGLDLCASQTVSTWTFVDWQGPSPMRLANTGIPKTINNPVEKEKQGLSKEAEHQPPPRKPPPTQFIEPSADSLLDGFGF